MEKCELNEINDIFGTLCKFLCINSKKMDTDAAIALARALEELLRAKAILIKG